MGMIEADNDGLYDGDDEIYSSFAVSTWWASRSNGGSDLPWMSEPLSFVTEDAMMFIMRLLASFVR